MDGMLTGEEGVAGELLGNDLMMSQVKTRKKQESHVQTWAWLGNLHPFSEASAISSVFGSSLLEASVPSTTVLGAALAAAAIRSRSL